MDDEEQLSNGQTIDEWLAEKKKTDRMLQLIDRDAEKLKRSVKGRIRKRWHDKAEAKAMADPVYAEIASRLPKKDGYTRSDLDIMMEKGKRWREIIRRPWYLGVLSTHDDWVSWRRHHWHRFRFQTLRIRTDSPFWHHMHNDLWVCPDCDSLFACRDQQSDPDHLCTAAIVDIDTVDLDTLDDEGVPWSMKIMCWRCGYTGRMAQRRERKKLRRRART